MLIMVQSRFVRWTVVCTMLMVSVVAVKLASAVDGTATAGQQDQQSQFKVLDIKLADGGVLNGQLVTRQGNPPTPQQVNISDGRQIVATTKTREDGTFVVRGLRGGTYIIDATESRSTVRLWAAGTAPPAAAAGALLVTRGPTVRGKGLGGISSGVLWSDEAKAICAGAAILGGAAILQYNRQGNNRAS